MYRTPSVPTNSALIAFVFIRVHSRTRSSVRKSETQDGSRHGDARRHKRTSDNCVIERFTTRHHARLGILDFQSPSPTFRPGMRVLEIAPDQFPSAYQKVVDEPGIQWESIDLVPGESLTYVATSEYSYPIAGNTFDIVVSGNVIEHVRRIWT